MDGGKIPPVHVITFGSPCQNLSLIGNRSGLAGAKSSLFYQAFRIIQEMRDATDNLLHLFFHGRLWRSHARTDSRRNEIATRTAAFLTLSLGEQERRYFYALMLRSRGKKALIYRAYRTQKGRGQGKIP